MGKIGHAQQSLVFLLCLRGDLGMKGHQRDKVTQCGLHQCKTQNADPEQGRYGLQEPADRKPQTAFRCGLQPAVPVIWHGNRKSYSVRLQRSTLWPKIQVPGLMPSHRCEYPTEPVAGYKDVGNVIVDDLLYFLVDWSAVFFCAA